jgi:hypothetical protein
VTVIFHETSPGAALSLARDRTFIPASSSSLNLDSGLNCFSKIGRYQSAQCLNGYGAIVHFEWTGQCISLGPCTPPPLPEGVLIDQAPWRLHIRGPVGAQDLRITRICFTKEALDAFCGNAPPARWPRRIWPSARRRRLGFLREMRSYYRQEDCYLQIG